MVTQIQMKAAVCFFLILAGAQFASAQSLDSVQQLEPVLIQAYSSQRTLEHVPASVGYIGSETLNRFSNTNLLPAVNTIPGVRMEERSPGSYRFSIRGSLLRSPFGVRNVKVYWNGLPFTDGGGNTYLNLLDFASIGSAEVIKGPGGSLYGAGTGGVVLLSAPSIKKDQIDLHLLGGSYGLQRYGVSTQLHHEKMNLRFQFFHQAADGYRKQSAMSRDALHADVQFLLNASSTLSATLLYADLYYQTPGGLTQEQFDKDPRQARPSAGPNRGAVEQRAAVSNKTPLMGISYDKDWSEQWSTKISAIANHTTFSNPTIRNYESRKENNVGARIENQFAFGEKKTNKITFGGEYQFFRSFIDVNGNAFGSMDTLQTKDELRSSLAMLFGQAEYDLPQNFLLTIGGSINYMRVDFNRSYPTVVNESRTIDPSFSPRIALLNRITPALSMFVSVSRGFSPPGIAELYPSRQMFDKNIQSERGVNLEFGIRAVKLKHGIDFDVAVYQFRLEDALVVRHDANIPGNPEYFVNAGATRQRGVEATASWHPLNHNRKTIVSNLKVWSSFAYNHYRFENYVQGDQDYSGNMITGVPPVVNTSGIDLAFREKLYFNFTTNYVDHTPLDDANSTFANEYFLLGARLGVNQMINRHQLHIYGGVDNALDRTYSLGNDLNAVAGRYFNAAAGRNFYLGLQLSLYNDDGSNSR